MPSASAARGHHGHLLQKVELVQTGPCQKDALTKKARMDYSGNELAMDYTPSANFVDSGQSFELRVDQIPAGAVPVVDEASDAVIGYRHESAVGVFRYFDLDGNFVGMSELGLEPSPIDPIDLVLLGAVAARVAVKGVTTLLRPASRAAAASALRVSATALSGVLTAAMRTTFKGLSVRSLKFTSTTAARMATKGRYVPLHILHLALKHGKRVPDPQGVKGAFMYTTKITRNKTEYTLEVVVRESDWTVLHFLYK